MSSIDCIPPKKNLRTTLFQKPFFFSSKPLLSFLSFILFYVSKQKFIKVYIQPRFCFSLMLLIRMWHYFIIILRINLTNTAPLERDLHFTSFDIKNGPPLIIEHGDCLYLKNASINRSWNVAMILNKCFRSAFVIRWWSTEIKRVV